MPLKLLIKTWRHTCFFWKLCQNTVILTNVVMSQNFVLGTS